MEGEGLLKVITFSSGAQPFVVRCEQETRVQDIVQAIAGIWGFKDAAQLFTLCRPAAGCPSTADVLQLLRGATLLRGGTLLTGHDRPKPDKAPLLLIRSIFGNTPPELEQNQAVQALTAVQVAADVAIGRYPPQADANLLQHLVKQGQNAVVLQMASCWPSGKQRSSVAMPRYHQTGCDLLLQQKIDQLLHLLASLRTCCYRQSPLAALQDVPAVTYNTVYQTFDLVSPSFLPVLLPGACLTLGPAQVLAGGDKLQLPATVNIGLNAQGLHIMDSMQYRWEAWRCCQCCDCCVVRHMDSSWWSDCCYVRACGCTCACMFHSSDIL
jgi:hypothetical protein